MTDKKAIERWARYIIPAVFMAETELQRKHPEWKVRLANITKEDGPRVAEEYYTAIATEIVTNAVDADGKVKA